jgi:hypothetical protein
MSDFVGHTPSRLEQLNPPWPQLRGVNTILKDNAQPTVPVVVVLYQAYLVADDEPTY